VTHELAQVVAGAVAVGVVIGMLARGSWSGRSVRRRPALDRHARQKLVALVLDQGRRMPLEPPEPRRRA